MKEKECNLCSDQRFECKEYPLRTRVMRLRGEIIKVSINDPIEGCKIRPLWTEFTAKMKQLQT